MNTQRLNGYPIILEGATERTSSLLGKVLGITALGFLATAAGVATAPVWGMFVGMIAVFALVFAIQLAKKASPTAALGMFLALGYFMGWEIAPIIHHYMAAIGPFVVFQAAATTGLGMAAMGCVAYLFTIDYRRVAGVGLAGLLVLVLAGIVSMFWHFMSPNTYSWLTLVVFTLLTVADFARIRAGGNGQRATVLALTIYLDAINIFLAVLQLLGGRRRD